DYTELLPLVHDGVKSRASQRLLAKDRNVYLTIDARLQKRVADVIHDRVRADPNLRGRFISAAVLDVATGDVLASVTYPLPDSVADYLNPAYFDRAAYATRAPGSTFKLATAMAGYRTLGDNVDTWTTNTVPGVLLPLAIEQSNNAYFSALAYEAGPDAMLDVIETFGFTVWRDGLTRAQKLTRLRRDLNDRAQTGFGQGELAGSPLLVARLAATVANDGKMPPINWLRDQGEPPSAAVSVITPAQARRLGAYMRQVVVGSRGTARRTLGNHGLAIAGKTGTAEQIGQSRRRVNNAWFTGFAPYREVPNGAPQIAVAVLIEAKPTDRGGQKLGGGSDAAPIAGSIFDEAVGLGIIRRAIPSLR
ncbi:MAG TPA: penicillin-binding transpeptidase domain-containing protein, partial [Rhodothermales bacterium]|nr:penicillin-binding transpeptidase domain-containing protein [Rhodothermales bacterium]